MKIESEKRLEAKIGQAVQKAGGLSVKLTNFIGIPDRLCLFPKARVCFVEVKTTGQKPRRVQEVVMNKLRKLGFDCRVIDRSEQIKQLIQDYATRT